MPALGDTDRVTVIEVTAKFIEVSVQAVSRAQGSVSRRRIFPAFIDQTLRAQLTPGLEALIVYERFAHGIGFWLRPLPVDAAPRPPLRIITAADVMARARTAQ